MPQAHPSSAVSIVTGGIVGAAGILEAGGKFIADVPIQGTGAVGGHIASLIVQIRTGDGLTPGHPDVVVVAEISVGNEQIIVTGVGVIADVRALHSGFCTGTPGNVHRRAGRIQKSIGSQLLEKDPGAKAAPGHILIPGAFFGDNAGVDGIAGASPTGLGGLHHNPLEGKPAVRPVGGGQGDAGISPTGLGTRIVEAVFLPYLHQIRRPDIIHPGNGGDLIGNQGGSVKIQPFPAPHIGILGADHSEGFADAGAVHIIVPAGLVVEDAWVMNVSVVAGHQRAGEFHFPGFLCSDRQHACGKAGAKHGKTQQPRQNRSFFHRSAAFPSKGYF